MYSNGWSWVNDPAVREEHFRIGRIIARQNLYRGPIPPRDKDDHVNAESVQPPTRARSRFGKRHGQDFV
jgi:hypothetical protein